MSRFAPQPISTSRRSNRDDVKPTQLTRSALQELAASLPQPISTMRFSNRSMKSIFSDRESIGCPSLSSSPESTNSSNATSFATLPDDFLPSRDFKGEQLPVYSPRELEEKLKRAQIERERERKLQQQLEKERDRAIKERDAELLREADLEREREQERMRQLFEKERETERKRALAEPPKKHVDKKRQLVPMSFIPARPPCIMIKKTDTVFASPKPTMLVYGSSASPMPLKDSDSGYFSPSSSSSSLLSPTRGDQVSDEFVKTVYSYLSMPHEVMARQFDRELAQECACSVADVVADRMGALRTYLMKYVDTHPDIRTGEGCW